MRMIAFILCFLMFVFGSDAVQVFGFFVGLGLLAGIAENIG